MWVETSEPCEVTIEVGGTRSRAGTFTVHGHHYAIVDVEGGGTYEVRLGEETVWPLPDQAPSRIRPARPRRTPAGDVRLLPDQRAARHEHTIPTGWTCCGRTAHLMDATRGGVARHGAPARDQVYADEPSAEMLEFIEPQGSTSRRSRSPTSRSTPSSTAWRGPTRRSGGCSPPCPAAMIFDDHDLRDDCNTSASWREQMARRVVARRVISGLGAYWVYQHLGNLSPRERSSDELLGSCARWRATGPRPSTRSPSTPTHDPRGNRWSYSRDLGGTRLLMLDSRSARQLTPGDRRMLDPVEWEWLDRGAQQGGRGAFCDRHVGAVPAPLRHPTSRAGTRRWRRGPGAEGRPAGRRRSARPSTWSTGRPSAVPSRTCPRCWQGSASP